jgi:hypothetical protein
MNLNLNLPYVKTAKELENESNSQTTLNIIIFMLSATYKEGIEGQTRRIYGRLQAKLEQALENKVETIELESAEVDMIRNVSKTKTPVTWSKWVLVLEDELSKDQSN